VIAAARGALFCFGIYLFGADFAEASGGNIGSGLVAIITLSEPSGTDALYDPDADVPNPCAIAETKAENDELSLSISAGVPLDTTVTPLGWAPILISRGVRAAYLSSESKAWSGIGIGGPASSQWADSSADVSWFASQNPSEMSGRYHICTGAFCFPANAAEKAFWSILRGPASLRSCSSFNSASFWRAVASAVLYSSVEVRHSDCLSRIPDAQYCANRKAIVAQAPTAAITPAISSPYQETSNHQLARSNSDGSTGIDPRTFWFVVAVIGVCCAPIGLIVFLVAFFWRIAKPSKHLPDSRGIQ
jgi:hypothetical protein